MSPVFPHLNVFVTVLALGFLIDYELSRNTCCMLIEMQLMIFNCLWAYIDFAVGTFYLNFFFGDLCACLVFCAWVHLRHLGFVIILFG